MAKQGRLASVITNHNTDDLDTRFHINKRHKSRKLLRKEQRKLAKQRHHQHKLNWIARKKGRFVKSQIEGESESAENEEDDESNETGSVSHVPQEFDRDKADIEYIERKLLKRKRSKGEPDAFQQLKKEFLNDGFDEDFINFLSNIEHMSPQERILKDDENSEKNLQTPEPFEESESEIDVEEEYATEDEEIDEKVRKVHFKGEADIKEIPFAKSEKVDLDLLYKQQLGLINKLSEGNIEIVIEEIIKIYQKLLMSGAVASELHCQVEKLALHLCNTITRTIIENENSVISLVAIQTALICALCNKVGILFGYLFCRELYEIINKCLLILVKNQESDDLRTNKIILRNCIMSFSVISFCNMLDMEIVYDLVKRLTQEGLTEHLAQILLTLLRYTGNQMRSYSKTSFKSILDHLCGLIKAFKSSLDGDAGTSRIRFFEQEIESFKQSRERPPLETFEYLQTLIIKGKFSSTLSPNPHLSSAILLNFTRLYAKETKGAIEILSNMDASIRIENGAGKLEHTPNSTPELLKRAVALRLYSNIQKSTFVAVMGASDVKDAIGRIMELDVKSSLYPQVVLTIIKCLEAESKYNAYYVHVCLGLTRLGSNIGKKFNRAVISCMIVCIQHVHESKRKHAGKLGHFFATLVMHGTIELRLLRYLKCAEIESSGSIVFITRIFKNFCTKAFSSDEMQLRQTTQIQALRMEECYEAIALVWNEHARATCELAAKANEQSSRMFQVINQII
ncbi:bifunctional Armadillo-type fold/Initiation factor eIF-4 gamma [Babesia duncani]|uniref:Bifunctional Armadillo-type fold/Initiation factor eIF-4 gamma n=1 Tax=Babesia duncani TaxID=323732 RepID=A0AAD9PMP3_9APIC|nr:bifunctional Armadillo-type fold/Initiation factor eIF-4 gamma [Babesia duncani]